ncbi:arginase family protein [Acidisoma silvae]|uniref:Arginase family protein n=1 Tax=Acidisoma silvae TaxID=2802396 RepID=A0A963YU17_9PROT|nr:arginase family protein [Acidisoma silvae]MCB8877041.1 arginase family protein [Acidisoma silvae]
MMSVNRAFTGIPSFLRARIAATVADYAGARIGILGVPFDEGSPFLPGSRMGPRAIREHSLRFSTTQPLYDPDRDKDYLAEELRRGLIVDCGDVDIRPANPARSFAIITARVREMLEAGLFPVILGGDHSITYPVFEAFDTPMHVIQFDAHQDYTEITEDLNRTNGQAFRHITGMTTCLSLTQIGIRGLRTNRALVQEMRANGNRVICMTEARNLGPQGIAACLPAGSDVYVSIDVDALDMSLVPGCVSGEPDGLTFTYLMDSLRAIAERHRIRGFDFVEVNPPLDIGTSATAYLGALIVTGFLGFISNQAWWAAMRDRADTHLTTERL